MLTVDKIEGKIVRVEDKMQFTEINLSLFDGEVREVFGHYKELEEIGLAAPQVTYLMAETGKTVTTVDEAVEILLG